MMKKVSNGVGQFQLVAWQEAFACQHEKQSFLDDFNTACVPGGVLPLDTQSVDRFVASKVLFSWSGQPMGHVAVKSVTPSVEVFKREISGYSSASILKINKAVIGSVGLIGFKGYGLGSFLVAHGTHEAVSLGAQLLTARSANPQCIAAFTELGYKVQRSELTVDGKSVLWALNTDITCEPMADAIAVALPTFVDGGKYD